MYQVDFSRPAYVYFIGIGGSSMSGLAECCQRNGWRVSGSDNERSTKTEKLQKAGIDVRYGQRYENVPKDADLVVYSAAINEQNPERVATRDLGIETMCRGDFLGQIMDQYQSRIAVSGTHGKTTTTSMISEIFMAAGTDPTLAIGGVLPSIHDNFRVGAHDYFIAEACEFTNSYLAMNPTISIILNIDNDHLDFFKSMQGIRDSFHAFGHKLTKDGFLIINGSIPKLSELTDDLDATVITFGTDSSYDYYYTDLMMDEYWKAHFTLHVSDAARKRIPALQNVPASEEFVLGVVGDHNACNALSAVAASDLCGIPRESTHAALLDYTGTERRFQLRGVIGGVSIYDDYAHHPTEVAAALKTAQKYAKGTCWVCYQPHTYSRTKLLMDDIAQALTTADKVILTDIMAARETDTLGITAEDLKEKVEKLGTPCYLCPSFEEAENFILENCINGDLLITMGCGNVVKIADFLVGE